MSSHKFP